ncbi:MAG: V-type ATPase subunit [Acholeplasma sp.]|nr:V-type ATPase subunit [Acholeplasma sp.]
MDLGFLNGVYYVKTESMLNEDDFNTLKRLEKNLFFKYLKTRDYGFGSKYVSLDKIIEQELLNVRTEVEGFIDNKLLTNVFYLKTDLTNIKIVYKSVRYDTEIRSFDESGSFSKDALVQAFKYNNTNFIPIEIKPLIEKLIKINDFDTKISLQQIERTTYETYLELISKLKDKALKKILHDYLKWSITIQNLETFLKIKVQSGSIERLQEALIEDEIISVNTWGHLIDSSNKEVLEKLYVHFNKDVVTAIEDFLSTLDYSEVEKEMTQFFLEVIKKNSYDSNTYGPVIYYLYLKELEALKVRRMYYGK